MARCIFKARYNVARPTLSDSATKQAAAKTITVLQGRGYVARDADPMDARRKRLQVTPLGFEVLRTGEAIFDELRGRWEKRIGTSQLENLEKHLTTLIGILPESFDAPGWMAQNPGDTD